MFNNTYEGKRVLITGNTGFKGSWLTVWLLQLGAKVIGYSKDVPTNPSMFKKLNLENKINHVVADVRNFESLSSAFTDYKPDFVFHLAAQSLVKNSYLFPSETMTTNIIGTNNILDCLRLVNHPCTGIIITSDKCYDNLELTRGYNELDALGGKDPYSASKGAAELVFKGFYHSFFKNQALIRVATARAGNVIGGGDWAEDRIIPDCIRAWEKGDKVSIRNPNSTRPWQHVLEPLSGYLRLGQQLSENKNLNGKSFNFGPKAGNNQTVLELIHQISNRYFENEKIQYEIIKQPSFHEAGLLQLDCAKANEDLSWEANLDFNQTANYTSDWYNNYKTRNMIEFTIKQLNNYCKAATETQLSWME
jgi:CDP-glucose 4,6-dehydratase